MAGLEPAICGRGKYPADFPIRLHPHSCPSVRAVKRSSLPLCHRAPLTGPRLRKVYHNRLSLLKVVSKPLKTVVYGRFFVARSSRDGSQATGSMLNRKALVRTGGIPPPACVHQTHLCIRANPRQTGVASLYTICGVVLRLLLHLPLASAAGIEPASLRFTGLPCHWATHSCIRRNHPRFLERGFSPASIRLTHCLPNPHPTSHLRHTSVSTGLPGCAAILHK